MPVMDDIGRDQSKEYGKISAIDPREIEAIAASLRGVYRDFESGNVGIGAGLVGHDSHLNGGVSNSSIGSIRDSARDAAVEGEKDSSRSPIEQDLIALQARKGVDASYTNPTMEKDAGGTPSAQELEQHFNMPSAPMSGSELMAASAPFPSRGPDYSKGLDGATQWSAGNLVSDGKSKGKEARNPMGDALSQARDSGAINAVKESGARMSRIGMFGDNGKAMGASVSVSAGREEQPMASLRR